MNDKVEQLLPIVKKALTQITSDYFKIITTYDRSGIIRERVFCYELYHRIRNLMDESEIDFNTVLNGEINKRGHLGFAEEDRKDPDFVFHVHGNFEDNTIVMEVKGRIDQLAGLKKDFATLLKFTTDYQYKLGILIIYNHSLSDLFKVFDNEMKELPRVEGSDKILIISIKESEKSCEETYLSKVI